MTLNSSAETCLRHPDCESARINKDGVFHRMRCALEQVIEIVTESRSCGENKLLPASIYDGIKDFKVSWEIRPQEGVAAEVGSVDSIEERFGSFRAKLNGAGMITKTEQI